MLRKEHMFTLERVNALQADLSLHVPITRQDQVAALPYWSDDVLVWSLGARQL